MIDITTLGEAFDPMAVRITIIVIIALFAFLWYLASRDKQERKNYIS